MNVGNNSKKIYYTLVRSERKTYKGIIRMIHVLHAVPDKESEGGTMSIFSSDIECDSETDAESNIFDRDDLDDFMELFEKN